MVKNQASTPRTHTLGYISYIPILAKAQIYELFMISLFH